MIIKNIFQKNILVVAMTLSSYLAIGQIEVRGTVYERTQIYPMPGVSVISTSGAGTITDSLGRYTIRIHPGDSLYFSYLGKPTLKFPAREIPTDWPFDMSLEVDIQSLPTVLVWPRVYRQDSLENRLEYQKIFEYGNTYINGMKMTRNGGMGVGVDFDMLFDGAKSRRIMAFQQRLIKEEQDKYIDHRFTKALVKKLTNLLPPALDTFMRLYRPDYDFLQSFENDYSYYKYIYDSGNAFSEIWKKEHGD
jgi:hypothetical protein